MKCLACSKVVKQISYLHLKYCCGLTPQEYKEKYGVLFLQDKDVRKRAGRPGVLNGRWIDGRRVLPRFCECGRRKARGAKVCLKCIDFSGERNPFYGKKHSLSTLKKIARKRSNTDIERAVAVVLDEAELLYTAQFFLTHEGKTYAYDFKLKGKPILIEVDGDYWHGGPSRETHFYKVKSVKQTDHEKDQVAAARGYKVIRVWGSEVKQNPHVVLERLNGVT